jgi:hypothetical protein
MAQDGFSLFDGNTQPDPRKQDFPFLMPFIGPEISDEPALEPDPTSLNKLSWMQAT